MAVEGFPHLNLPQVCPNQPPLGSALCSVHRDGSGGGPATASSDEIIIRPDEIEALYHMPGKTFRRIAHAALPSTNFLYRRRVLCWSRARVFLDLQSKQRRVFSLSDIATVLRATVQLPGSTLNFDEVVGETCRKNLGAVKVPTTKLPPEVGSPKFAALSRGYMLITRPCGQIRKAVPLYK